MTPFGIRKRLKKLIGFGGGDASESGDAPRRDRPKISITLVSPDGGEETCEALANSSVLFATGNMAKPLGSGCADATCATCRCEVLEGEENLTPQSEAERACLESNKHPTTLRLGCQAEVRRGAVKIRGYEFVV